MDPIPFHDSIYLVLEGERPDGFHPQPSYTVRQYLDRVGDVSVSLIANLVLFYFQPGGRLIEGDSILLAETQSAERHHLVLLNVDSHRQVELKSVKADINSTTYLDNKVDNSVYSHTYLRLNESLSVKFKLASYGHHKRSFQGAFIRRKFVVHLGEWNFSARIKVNGVDHGIWSILKGTTTPGVNLGEDDFVLNFSAVMHRKVVEVEIEPLTTWNDISYTVFFVESND